MNIVVFIYIIKTNLKRIVNGLLYSWRIYFTDNENVLRYTHNVLRKDIDVNVWNRYHMTYNRRNKGDNTAISYFKLWKLLIDKNMSASEMRKATKIAPNTLTRMRKEQEVSLNVLGKICKVLDCDFGDIIEYKKDQK